MKLPWKDLCLGLGLALALLAAGEAVCRLAGFAPGAPGGEGRLFTAQGSFAGYARPDPQLGYRLRENLRVAEYRFNSLGYRGRDFPVGKPPGTFRVVCLGGSTTLGSNVPDILTYPALLQDLFDTTGRGPGRVEVINAGVFGYHSWHTLARIRQELDALEPDALVLMDGLNDVFACSRASLGDIRASIRDSSRAMSLLVADRGVLQRLRTALERLALFRALVRALGRFAPAPQPATPRDGLAERLEAFGLASNLEQAIKEAGRRGVGVVLVNTPWIVLPEGGPPAHRAIPEADLPAYAFGRSAVPAALEALASRHGLPLADPQPVFDAAQRQQGPEPLFNDSIHFTPLGNYLVAREVFGKLLELPAVRQAAGLDAAPAREEQDGLFLPLLLRGVSPSDGCLDNELVDQDAPCPLPRRILRLGNLDAPEGKPPRRWRMGLAPETELRFFLEGERPLLLELACVSALEGQVLEVWCPEGPPVRLEGTPRGQPFDPAVKPGTWRVPLPGRRGENVIRLRYALQEASEGESRRFGAAFLSLRLGAGPAAPPPGGGR